MKRKLVLKAEKVRVLTAIALDVAVGAGKGGPIITVMQNDCVTIFSQASICVGSKG